MSESEQLSQLVGEIYDTTLDAASWPQVIPRIAEFVGVSVVNLFAQDALKKNANVLHIHGLDPEYVRSYLEEYIRLNPNFPAALFFPVGKIIRQDDMMPLTEFQETLFWKEWIAPQRIVDSMAAILEKSAVSCAVFSVLRHERDGPVDERAYRRMCLLVPHVQRAVLVGKAMDLAKIDGAALADTLDGMAAGTILVDADGCVVHANARAREMLASGDAVRLSGIRLGCEDAGAERILREIFAVAGTGDSAVGTKGIAVPIAARGGKRYFAHVLPLTSGARRLAGVRYSAVAAVFVQDGNISGATVFETIAQHFKLTPAELRVMFGIVEIGGVPEVAPVLGVSENTVKTHLQHVFEKTGTSRQADLVKLVAGFMSPLAGDRTTGLNTASSRS
jgi:DNA-binding CsgD family transcriptional regulator/PAS domain-containing protein